MERVQELIEKLRKQQQQGEAPERMLATVQSLQDALLAVGRKNAAPGAGKVAVVLPPKRRITTVEVSAPPQTQQPAKPEPSIPAEQAAPTAPDSTFDDKRKEPVTSVIEQAPVIEQQPVAPAEAVPLMEPEPPAPENPPAIVQQKDPYFLQKPALTEAPPLPAPPPAAPPAAAQPEEREVYHLHFDTADEVPTLTQQHYNAATRELHEVIGEAKESLNDRLKQDKPELGNKLKEAPIKDLRKAIGVNDKFLFVRELFRDDEAMYERSIKTINNFHILAEAEYWISRELKVKLGWDDSRDTVQAFYQLVKRRFS